MKNKMIMGALMLLLVGGMAFGRNYELDETATIDLSNITEVTFDLRGVNCSLCVRSIDILSEISGDGSGRDMILSLNGSITSNREKAVPSLNVDETGRKLTVSLYPDRKSFFGLNQGGRADFTAVLPQGFDGIMNVSGASDDMIIRNLDLEEMDIRTSSGDLDATDLEAELMSLRISSGDMRGDNLVSTARLSIESSSGRLTLGRIVGDVIQVEASSGDITIDSTGIGTELGIKASSGRISGGILTADEIVLDSSSGKITVDEMSSRNISVDVSSGDVSLEKVNTEIIKIELSSGDLEIGDVRANLTEIKTSGDTDISSLTGAVKLNGSSGGVDIGFEAIEDEVVIDVSSGDITLKIPENSGFDAEVKTSSGRIRSEFPVLGDLSSDGDGMKGSVNGGGSKLQAETSSGNINLLVR